MEYAELMRTVRASSPADWIHHEEEGVHTLRNDIDIRIERIGEPVRLTSGKSGLGWHGSREDVASVYVTDRQKFGLYYRSSLARTFILVILSGGYGWLPLPDPATGFIPADTYRLAACVDAFGHLDEHIAHAGLAVGP